MSPERWQQINDLFDAALLIDSAERDAGSARRATAMRIFGQRSAASWRATSAGTRRVSAAAGLPSTGGRPSGERPARPRRSANLGADRPERSHRIPTRRTRPAASRPSRDCRRAMERLAMEIASLVRKRLRALAIIYLFLFGILPVWRSPRPERERLDDHGLQCPRRRVPGGHHRPALGAPAAPPARLKSLELGMVGLIACLVATIYYRRMLTYALQGELTKMQIQMEHFVLRPPS